MESPTFPRFNLLPTELRLQIWRHAIPRRTIAVRFKQDLDAWNWASEENWWLCQCIRLDLLKPRPQLPPVSYANREARGEVLKWHRGSLHIDRATVQRILPELDGATVAEICKAHVHGLNLDGDVVEWPRCTRRTHSGTRGSHALFLGACLKLQHVSVEYEWCRHPLFPPVAAAVLDRARPLQTLTVTAVDRRGKRNLFQIRLARRPPNRAVVRVRSCGEVRDALRRHSAVFMPWFNEPPSAVDGGGGVDGQKWQSPHPMLKDELSRASLLTLPDDAQLGSEYAFFLVLRQSDLDDTQFLNSLATTEMRAPPELLTLNPDHETAGPWQFGTNIQVDIVLWREMMSKFPVLLGNTLPDPPPHEIVPARPIPCHGFCSSGYGLPDSQEPWDSFCWEQNAD